MCGASGTARTRAPSRPRPCSRRPRTATRPRPCLIAPPAEPDRGPTSLRPRRAMLGPGRRRLGPEWASSARRGVGGNHGSTQARRCEPRCTVLPLRRTRWYPGMPPARAPYLALISRAPGACALIICVRTSPGVSPCPMCMGSVCRRRVLSGLARSPPCRGGWGGEPMRDGGILGFRGAWLGLHQKTV